MLMRRVRERERRSTRRFFEDLHGRGYERAHKQKPYYALCKPDRKRGE
jgi:hypothetical protein